MLKDNFIDDDGINGYAGMVRQFRTAVRGRGEIKCAELWHIE